MKQHRLATGRSVFEFLLPFPNQFAHVRLGLLELLYLLIQRAQFLFCQIEYAMTGSAAVVADAKNLGQFMQREA